MRYRDSEAIGQERGEGETAVGEAEDWHGGLREGKMASLQRGLDSSPAEIFP